MSKLPSCSLKLSMRHSASRYVCLCLALTLVALCASPVAADPIKDRYLLTPCSPTPSIATSNYPGFSSIPPNSKLALPAGKSIYALGQPVYFYGRVFDANCVPVSEAKIELWQANPDGNYRFATPPALATPDPIFAGAGRATSDNLGQFHFLTLFPGPYSYLVRREDDTFYRVRRAPHFNLRVTHPDLRSFRTNLFFANDHRNPTDHHLKRLSESTQSRVLMSVAPHMGDYRYGIQAFIDIILPDKQHYRKY